MSLTRYAQPGGLPKTMHLHTVHTLLADRLVTVGVVGTPVKYNCSVFGSAVTLASRCAGVPGEGQGSSSVILPTHMWGNRQLDDVFPPEEVPGPDGVLHRRPQIWELRDAREEDLKNIGTTSIREIALRTIHVPQFSHEDDIRNTLRLLQRNGQYRPADEDDDQG